MSETFVDTDVIIRLLARDDEPKRAAAEALFQRIEAGELVLNAPDTVIADAVYVLSSRVLYNRPRAEIRELLTPILRLLGFKVRNRRILLRALDIYATTTIDFGDAMIVASMHTAGSSILYAYDRDYDRIPGITRREPEPRSANTGGEIG